MFFSGVLRRIGKRKNFSISFQEKGEKGFQKLRQIVSKITVFGLSRCKIPFFHATFGRVNRNFKRFLVDFDSHQYEGKISDFLCKKNRVIDSFPEIQPY